MPICHIVMLATWLLACLLLLLGLIVGPMVGDFSGSGCMFVLVFLWRWMDSGWTVKVDQFAYDSSGFPWHPIRVQSELIVIALVRSGYFSDCMHCS